MQKEAYTDVEVAPQESWTQNIWSKEGMLEILKLSRYLWSFMIICFSGFIIIYGILAGESGFSRTFPSCPNWLALVVFFFLIVFFGLLEGGHVCLVDLSKHSSESFRDKYHTAASVHKWVSGRRIFNLSKYLMGRQVMVIFNQFFLGSLASFPGMHNFPFTDHPFPTVFKNIMVDTGLLNVVFVTCFGSLVPQLIATRYPVQFMNMMVIKVIVAVGLGIEASGIAHFSWVLHHVIAKAIHLDHEVTRRVMADDPSHGASSSSDPRLARIAGLLEEIKMKNNMKATAKAESFVYVSRTA